MNLLMCLQFRDFTLNLQNTFGTEIQLLSIMHFGYILGMQEGVFDTEEILADAF